MDAKEDMRKNRFTDPFVKDNQKGERGVALLVVMFVIATLSILVLEFMHSTRINLYIAGNIADGMKAFYLSQSGVNIAAGALLNDVQDNDNDHLFEDWAQALPAMPGGEGWVTVEIADESSKLNINKLVRKSGLPDTIRQEVFSKILLDLELDPELIKPIIDWIDGDEEAQNGGVEDSIYGYNAGLDPYPSKNGPFLSINELTLVQGITDEIYRKIKPYITIYGNEKLNLNTVDETILRAYMFVLTGEDDDKVADQIISWRNEEDIYFKEKKIKKQLTDDLEIDPAIASKITKYFSTKSNYFSVKTEAIVAESTKRCLGIVQRGKKRAKIIYFRPI